MKRTLAIARKEWMHILRDSRSLIILFLMPVMMVFLFGYAINMNVKHIPLGIWDGDRTPESRAVISEFTQSGYFTESAHLSTIRAVNNAIRKKQVSAVMAIPNGYARKTHRGHPPPIGFWVDGSDANTASVVINYTNALLSSRGPQAGQINPAPSPFDVRPKIFYNPELESSHFIVPGLIAVLMMMICAMLTSLTIVREKETGTFEQMLVSPIRAPELIIGKVLPYLSLAFIVAGLILAVGHWHFGVPIHGNLIFLAATLVIYLFCALALGLLISTIAPSQRVAMLMAVTTTLLPSVILSGFIFPIRSMPLIIQLIAYIIPARYFLVILRGIMLKGSTLDVLWTPTVILTAFGVFLVAVSVFRFRKSMVKA